MRRGVASPAHETAPGGVGASRPARSKGCAGGAAQTKECATEPRGGDASRGHRSPPDVGYVLARREHAKHHAAGGRGI
eukprot:CAMPEP_0176258912 /NCGR_PEP_ID=MMETSP0121_2-20121125/38804_1 /TAXON_ID=160619 /ORGANISM="Kryptoperidinium foliaceum, Strain CCMP 1326" /LENGTH=77 /DNA_ID=CAMNT_0017598791 /DNA_START=1 /DNA_END=231 /DNA_ORIENTATION=-